MSNFEISLNLPWSTSSVSSITSSLSSLYCLLTITIYVVLTVNNLAKTGYSQGHAEIEASNFIQLMLVMACMFLIYLLLYLTKPQRSHSHRKSHGSAFLRQGAAVFGLGTGFYFLITFVSHIIAIDCIGFIRTINSFLFIVFVFLQMITIILYPRLNLDLGFGLPHFGLMHLVATNLILWIKTVIKESILEYHEAIHELDEEHNINPHAEDQHANSSCLSTLNDEYDYIFAVVRESSPILFAFIIEFALIGATVFYNMWHHVAPYTKVGLKLIENPHVKPNIRAVMTKTDWSHSAFGAGAGLVIFLFNITALCIFFRVASDEEIIDEYLEKVTRCITNSYGIIATVIGVVQIQKLVDKPDPEDTSVDVFLLNLGGTFSFVYMCFTITVGIFTENNKNIAGSLHIINGVINIVQITVQIVLIKMFLHKVIQSREDSHPGRQTTTFLVLMNFTLWLVDTFELQKRQASVVEAHFYGATIWVFMQRLTLPLAIFFRFHSTVVLIDCWKNSYRIELKDDAL